MRKSTRGIVAGTLVGAGVVALALWSMDQNVRPDPVGPALVTLVRPAPNVSPAPLPPPVMEHEERVHRNLLLTPVYAEHQLLVSVRSGADAYAIAQDVGGTIPRSPGSSGYAMIDVSDAADPVAALQALQDHELVQMVAPNARIYGADDDDDDDDDWEDVRPWEFQWHLDALRTSSVATRNFSDITVAVIDSGVAYESATRNGVQYRRADAFRYTTVVAPYDFVNDDPWANDDHMHGTHIASIIGADRYDRGVARRATLMPLKVLDADNSGTEIDLVDAIWWAIDNGADVINLSLSMHPDYVPSRPLGEALWAAEEAGVVVVAASGNDGLDRVSWPAAHPSVIAVGASTVSTTVGEREVAWYSNGGNAVDFLAPGGDLSRDADGDGWPDGILAETLRPGSVRSTGYYYAAGTSQAAAVASGVVAQLLHDGVPPEDVRYALHLGTSEEGKGNGSPDNDPHSTMERGQGAGHLELFGSLDAPLSYIGARRVHAGILPWLEDKGSQVRPRLDLVILDHDGLPVSDSLVYVTLRSADGTESLNCDTDADGLCSIESYDRSNSGPQAFQFTVDAVSIDGRYLARPSVMRFESEPLVELHDAIRQTPGQGNPPMAIEWTEGHVSDLGDVAEGYSMISSGTGLATLPIGVTFNKRAGTRSGGHTISVELDGYSVNVSFGKIDGTGLATLPIGLRRQKLAFIDGTGLATLPIGFTPKRFFVTGASVDATWMEEQPADVNTPGYGWTESGFDAASAAMGAGLFEPTVSGSGSVGVVQFPWVYDD